MRSAERGAASGDDDDVVVMLELSCREALAGPCRGVEVGSELRDAGRHGAKILWSTFGQAVEANEVVSLAAALYTNSSKCAGTGSGLPQSGVNLGREM